MYVQSIAVAGLDLVSEHLIASHAVDTISYKNSVPPCMGLAAMNLGQGWLL